MNEWYAIIKICFQSANGQWEAEIEGKIPIDWFRILTKKKAEYDKLLKQRTYKRRQIYLIIDLDHVAGGIPCLRV
jgi:hypothetical protein